MSAPTPTIPGDAILVACSALDVSRINASPMFSGDDVLP